MKLSRLIEALQEIEDIAKTDPEVNVMIDDAHLEFTDAIMTSTCDVSIKRGDLSPEPKWSEELTIYMVENGP